MATPKGASPPSRAPLLRTRKDEVRPANLNNPISEHSLLRMRKGRSPLDQKERAPNEARAKAYSCRLIEASPHSEDLALPN